MNLLERVNKNYYKKAHNIAQVKCAFEQFLELHINICSLVILN